VDESGKGDFFGPLVVAAAYCDETLASSLREVGVKDSKLISSDAKALAVADAAAEILGKARFAVLCIPCGSYNRIYAKERNLNKMLAVAHARCIAKVLEGVPSCRRAVSDQFGDGKAVGKALAQRWKGDVIVESRPRAESDIAVAAASVLARARFIREIDALQNKFGPDLPKGATTTIVVPVAVRLAEAYGPGVLVETSKCHFKTLDKVLAAIGSTREAMPPEGRIKSIPPSAVRRWGR
jgi:ribonuclease HIII